MIARVVEIAVGDPGAAQEEHLQKPVEQDRDLAEEEMAVDVGRDQDVIDGEQRSGQHGADAKDVEEVRQRREAPLVPVQAESEIDEPGVNRKQRQIGERQQLGAERRLLEAHDEGQDDRSRADKDVVQHDQDLARGQGRQSGHNGHIQGERSTKFVVLARFAASARPTNHLISLHNSEQNSNRRPRVTRPVAPPAAASGP